MCKNYTILESRFQDKKENIFIQFYKNVYFSYTHFIFLSTKLEPCMYPLTACFSYKVRKHMCLYLILLSNEYIIFYDNLIYIPLFLLKVIKLLYIINIITNLHMKGILKMNPYYKNRLIKLLPSTIIIISLILATIFSYNNMYNSAQTECWSRLENASDVVVNEIKTQFDDDINILKLIAQTMANDNNLQSHNDFIDRVKSFQTVSLFERIDIEYPDNTLVLQDGSSVDCIHTFDQLVKQKEHMSSPQKDTFTNKQSIFYYVPIERENSPIAYLIGVINCESLSSYFKNKIYDGQTQNIIIDTKSQKLVMSEHNNTNKTFDIMKGYTLEDEYKTIDVHKKITKNKSGTVKYHNKNVHYYMRYCPVGIFGWELLIIVREDVAFNSLLNMQKSYIFLIIFILLLLAVYFAFNLYRIHKISEKEKKSEIEKEKIAHKLDISNTLIACVKELSSSSNNIHHSIQNLLEIINTYFNAERTYLVEIDESTKKVDTIFEHRIQNSNIYNVENQKNDLENIDISALLSIHKEIIYFKNILNEIPKNASMYSSLKSSNIQDLIIIPFKENNSIYAILGIDNPKKNTENIDFVQSIKYFIGESLKREKETSQLERLSYEDALTHAFNRNKYNELIKKYENQTVHNVGVVFFDLNGLKEVNDKYGHIAGDTLIQITASIFQQVFLQNTYRIGGDEFVIIQENIEKEEFEEKLKRIDERTTLNEISISKGVLWKKECSNLYEMLQEADQIMYKNKANYYSQSQNDRRRRS